MKRKWMIKEEKKDLGSQLGEICWGVNEMKMFIKQKVEFYVTGQEACLVLSSSSAH